MMVSVMSISMMMTPIQVAVFVAGERDLEVISQNNLALIGINFLP